MKEEENKKTRKGNKITDYEEEELNMGDKYDVIKFVGTVNSPISTMNPDFILGDLNTGMLSNPLIKFVRSQLKIIEAVNIHLTQEGDEEYKTRINQLMLNDVYSLENLSRADKAKVINAILEYIKSGEGTPAGSIPTETTGNEEPKQGILQRLNPFSKKETWNKWNK